MEEPVKQKLLVLITNQFAAINLIHTGFLQKLADKYSVQIRSDFIDEQGILQISRYFEIALTLVRMPAAKEPTLIRMLRLIEKVLFFQVFRANTHQIKIMEQSKVFRGAVFCIDRLPYSERFARRMLENVRSMIIYLSGKISQPGLKRVDFAGVISSSPLDIRENAIVNGLTRHKVPALAILISWDNLTSKGIINANHDYVLVWNELMACEFENFYSSFHPKLRIVVTGIPRFDVYNKRATSKPSHLNFRKRLLITGSMQTILFATSAPRHFPNQLDVVDDLLEYCRKRLHTILIIRLHPADCYSNYERYLGERFVRILKSSLSCLPELDFLDVLANTIYSSNVCVQVASTMRLDAIACGKPVISIAYDGRANLPYKNSVRRLYDYSHQIPLNALNVDKLVFSKQQLFDCLNEVLSTNHQQINSDAALRIYAPQCKGGSVASMIRYVDEWLA